MVRHACVLAALTLLAACSTPATATSGYWLDAGGDVPSLVVDMAAPDNGAAGADAADAGAKDAAADGLTADAAPGDVGPILDAVADAPATTDAADADSDTVNWGDLLDPTTDSADAAAPPDVVTVPTGPVGSLYAHTSDTLYRLDLKAGAFVKIGYFSFDKNPGSVTDIALDQNGNLFAVTFAEVFQCGVAKANCTWLASLPSSFNGLTFVAKGVVDPNAETLIGISTSGDWNQIIVKGKTATIVNLGAYGGGWSSSGDAFSVEGIGTYATVTGNGNSDSLVQVDPKTGKVQKTIGSTGVYELYGLAWWSGVFYGFSADGNVYTLDTATGKAKVVAGIKVPTGVAWWGAGVSTRAAGTPTP